MRKRGLGFHGIGRGGTVHAGAHGSPGRFAARVIGGSPGFTAAAPAPKITGDFAMPQNAGTHAPTMPTITRRR